MKKTITKALLALICLILIIPSLATVSYAEEENNVYYCREALKSLPDSDKLIYAYDKIVEGVSVSDSEISVFNGTDNISIDELKIVYDAYRRDHAEHFWLGSSYTYSYNSETVTSIKPSYVISGSALDTAKLEFENAIDNILEGVTSSMTEYEKEKYLHDTLAVRVTYVEGGNAHNAYGALVEGKAVCEGYAEALQCLLHRVGIQSFIAIGSSVNPSTGSSEGHAWNTVKIDGKYYHLDLTWNDQGSKLFYAYFNVSDEIITKDHVIDEAGFPIPQCNSLESFYFKKEGAILNSYTVNSIAFKLKMNSLAARLYIPDGVDEFINWLNSNITSIAEQAGVTSSFNWSYSILGGEVVLIIDTCAHNHLIVMNAKAPTCTSSGNIAYYKCFCGKYFSDNRGKNEILNKDSVILPASHSFMEKTEDSEHLRSTPLSCAEYYTYYYGCTKCGEISASKYFTSNKTLPHTPQKVEGFEPSCSSEGQKSYYSCSCGKHFEDADAKKEITDIKNYATIQKSPHGDTDALGRCTVCGELAEITDGILKIGLVVAGALIGLPILIAILKRVIKKKRK